MNPKTLLEAYDILPKKSLGQNFLHDPNALDKIVSSAELSPDDAVLEIGAGAGFLTTRLAQSAERVVAVELDDRLRPILDEALDPFPNVELIYNDILNVDVPKLFAPRPFKVVANLPYYITSAILKHLLESDHRPTRLVMTVQSEVAERIMAKPDDMSILSVSVQFFGKPRLVTRLNPAAFWPRPEIESTVLRIDTYPELPIQVPDIKTFFQVVRAGFSQKRKQIKNSLAGGLALSNEQVESFVNAAGIDPRRRAETLTLAEWGALTRSFAAQHSK